MTPTTNHIPKIPAQAARKTKSAPTHPEIFTIDAPTVATVQLVGDFTGWQEKPISLKRSSNGYWQAVVSLRPGRYQYRFIVDGQWQDEPQGVEREPNPFGGANAVRHVI